MHTPQAPLLAPWRLLRRRYSVDALCYAAVQTLGYAIIFAAVYTPAAWNRFSLEYLQPNMIWVMWTLLAPPHSGEAIFLDMFALCGIAGAVAVAAPAAFITYAAAPGDNLPSPQKAAALICFTAFCYFWVTVARWRFPLLNPVGRLTQIGSAMALLPGYWASQTGMQDIGYIACYVVIVIAIGLLVTFLLIPLPTAMFARRAAARAMSKVAQVQREAAGMFGAAGTAGEAPSETGTSVLYDLDTQATKLLRSASTLNGLTAFDFAVYWRPHRHPRQAYAGLLKLAVRVERLILAAAVETPRAFPELQRLVTAQADAVDASSAALSSEAQLETVLEASAAVAMATSTLLEAGLDKVGPKGTGVPSESFELLIMAALRVRELCEEALPLVMGRPGPAPAPVLAPPKIDPSDRLGAPEEPAVELEPAGPWWRLAWRRWATATGVRPWHVALALQLTIVYISAALLSTNEDSYIALGGDTQWILITIFVISDMTAGAVAVAGVDRVAGCAVGCTFSAAVVGLALAINGGSYDNTAGKLVTIAVCLSLWAGWCRAERTRAAPHSDKFYSQASMVPMVCVVSQATKAPWQMLGYRIANVAIGVALQLAVSCLVFPISTLSHSRTLVAAALQDAAEATDATFQQLSAAGESEEGEEEEGDKSDVERGAAAEAERAQSSTPAEDRLVAAIASAQEHLDQMVLLSREAVVFWGFTRKAGPEHEALARTLQVYLSHLSTCVAERNLLSRAGAWRLDAQARQRCVAAGAQLAAALRALELVVTGYASVKHAKCIKEAVCRISAEMEAAAATPDDVPPSKLPLVASAVLSRAFARVTRQLEVVYAAADAAFQLKCPT